MTTDWNSHSPHPEHCLGEISVDDFLKDYWQQKPLLVRNAFPGLVSPLSAEELAGLACEEGVNARLVLEKGRDKNWQAEFAPIAEDRFAELPDSHWSLLVSDIERHIPEAAFLLKPFRFIPDWRIDDLMISYAPPGGSVGPHTDEYDVFLIQLSGQRLWKISEHYDPETRVDTDLCVLKNFEPENEWLLNPGDMLYLPPRVAHHGIAQDADGEQCLTASAGFRAPSLKSMTADYVSYLNEHLHGTQRYRDNSPEKPEHHALISEATIAHFIDYLQQGLSTQPELVKDWLGRFRSDNRNFEDLQQSNPPLTLDELLLQAENHELRQSPWSKFLFADESHRKQNDNETPARALLFVDGESYHCSRRFAYVLCDEPLIDVTGLKQCMDSNDKNILLSLYNKGAVFINNKQGTFAR